MRKIGLFVLMSLLVHSAFALFPVREYKNMPDKFGMKYEEVKIATTDNEAQLNAWLFETPSPTFNWVIISHSGDGNMADNLERVNNFLSAGYNVLIYDYRGYGSSSDFTIENDMYIYPQFIIDLNSVCDWIKGAKKINRFDLYGIGIGAGLSIGVGANRPETKHVVADAPWTSLQTMEKKILSATGKAVTMPFAFDKNYEPEFAFEKPTPHLKGVMAIVADKDAVLGSKDLKAVKGITSVYVVKGCEQNPQNFAMDKNLYFQKVVAFMNN
jgi:uncharacterized protein